jgi:hypothetical protein
VNPVRAEMSKRPSEDQPYHEATMLRGRADLLKAACSSAAHSPSPNGVSVCCLLALVEFQCVIDVVAMAQEEFK